MSTQRILLIDNYDSFVFNLYQLIGQVISRYNLNFELQVVRNDQLSFEQIVANNYSHIIIGPGPGSPDNEAYFGVCSRLILELGTTIPTLGICLGMQGICHYYGGQVIPAPQPMHGKISTLTHSGQDIFKNIPQNLEVMRYHSLICTDLPDCLDVIATSNDGITMALKHKQYPIYGVQFHPESFATECGEIMIKNFLDILPEAR
jgi:anthranilate synthase component II